MVKRLLVLVLFFTSCVSSNVLVANAVGGVAPVSLSVAVMPTTATSTTVPTKTVKPVKTTVPVKPKNKNVNTAVSTTVPVIANVSNISTGASGSAGSNVAVVLPVEIAGLISVCVNRSTSVLRDTADNSCSSGSEVIVEWLDSGISPKICVNNNNREMTLAQDGKCATKTSAVADVIVNKQILACADDKTGVLRYQKSGVCGTNDDPVVWVLKDQGVARNVDSGVKKGVVEIISLIPTGTGSTKTVTTNPATNTFSATTTTTTLALSSTTTTTTTTTTSSTTTTTTVARASGSLAGYFGGTCPDGSGIPWYWGTDGTARAGGCSAAASIAPTTTAPATTTTAVSATTVAPVVIPGTPATPTGVAGNAQVTVSVTAGTGGTPTSYTITKSTDGVNYSTGCTVTGASGSCAVTGLTNGTAYFFKTTATNSAGTSGLSTASSSVTPATVPGAPTIGTATVASATSVTVACTAPGSNGGATITTYTATAVGTAITGTLTSATCSSAITVSGLTTGTAYTFTVTATNSQGTSVVSAASNSVTPAVSCAAGGTCVVGNTGPGGGFVFYVQASGGTFTSTGSDCGTACKYLEAAPTDQSSSIVWATAALFCYAAGSDSGTSNCESNSIYSNSAGQAASRTDAELIGRGMANTNQIYARLTTAGAAPTANYAAGIAWAYSNNGKADWHLPSSYELNQMCKWFRGVAWTSDTFVCTGGTSNSATYGANTSGLTDEGYHSSSEELVNGSRFQTFNIGGWQSTGFKVGLNHVRPIRAFG